MINVTTTHWNGDLSIKWFDNQTAAEAHASKMRLIGGTVTITH